MNTSFAASLIEMDQIHQREGEIVEDIRRGDDGIELDGIEQQRPAVHQRNIGKVQVAVAAAHKPLPGTLSEQRLQCRRSIAAGGIELIDGDGIKSAHGAKLCGIPLDDGWNGGKPAFTVGPRRLVVGSQNRVGYGFRQRWIDRLRCRNPVE